MMKFFRQSTTLTRTLFSLAVLVGLSACGGGGSSSTGTSGGGGNTTPEPSCSVKISGDASLEIGKTAGLLAQSSCGGTIKEITWTQTSGATIPLIASRSPVLAIETLTVGAIGLRADATLDDGRSISGTTTVNFTASSGNSAITVRVDHAVRSKMATSVRAWATLKGNDRLGSIAWTQTAGPTVTMNTNDQNLLMFTAPTVTVDTVLKFKASLNTTSTTNRDSDEVTILVEGQTARSDTLFETTERVYPYRKTAKYAGVLAKCVYDVGIYYASSSDNGLCKVSTLPLIANEVGIGTMPTVEQVMGRVLVSHDYLGANFEAFLRDQDTHGDFRRLLSGVSAIVIGSHVRPSFYQSATGAIYLDARYLWLSPSERDIVTEVPDYRSDFGSELSYTVLWRPILNNSFAGASYPSTERNSRPASELIFSLGRLLYHELAHAGDFFSPADRTLDQNATMWANVVPRLNSKVLISDSLSQRYPLMSAEMKGLGRVQFLGDKATAIQKAYTPTQVAGFFASDLATDDYAYAFESGETPREDLAMLFEEFMMAYRHGVQYDIAFSPYITATTPRDQFTVVWGQRGRVGVTNIKPRVKLVVQNIAPWIDVNTVDTLRTPILMKAGASWDANLVLSTGSGTTSTVAPPPKDDHRSLSDFRHHHHSGKELVIRR